MASRTVLAKDFVIVGLLMTDRPSRKNELTCQRQCLYSVSQKNPPPCGFMKFFPKWLGIFDQFFTHLLCYHFSTLEYKFLFKYLQL